MNFLIFRIFFLNFSKFKIDLFDFYFCAGDVAASGASDRAINCDHRSSLKAAGGGVRGTILIASESF